MVSGAGGLWDSYGDLRQKSVAITLQAAHIHKLY